jgi:hypothetical protein
MMSIDIELEIAKMLCDGKKVLIAGSIGRGKTYLTNKILQHFDTEDVIKHYSEKSNDPSYVMPDNVLRDDVFIDMLHVAIVFDCSYGFNDIAFMRNRRFEKIKKCLCGVLITATSDSKGLEDKKINSVNSIFDVVVEILPQYKYQVHHLERVG